MRIRIAHLVGILGVVLLGVIVANTGGATHTGAANTVSQVNLPSSTMPPQERAGGPTAAPRGAPAIRLMPGVSGQITREDVVAFVQHSPMPRTLGPRSLPQVIRADLLRSDAISALLRGESTGFPATQLLWFVEVKGTFVFPGPRGSVLTNHLGYEVFQPETGNLVMFGGLG